MSEQHNIADNRRKLYDALQHHVANIGSWDDFNRRMDDESNRRKVYEVAQQRVANMGSWDEFNSRVYAAPTVSPAQPVASQDPEGTQATAQVPAQAPEVPDAVPTQEPWRPNVRDQIQAAEAVRVGMDAFNAGSRERMERLKRSAEPLTAEGREARKAKVQEARSAGVTTKVSGLMAPVSPVPSDESVAVPADAVESQPSRSMQSPVPYGVKYVDGKPVAQWLLPDGTITTDLSEAEQAEYKARGARLRHEFEGRMKQNGLSPDKPEDMAMQAQLDMQAPMRDIVAGLWGEAEDAYKADRDQASGREWDAYAHGMGGPKARIVSASVDRHARDVTRMKHFDLQKMSDAAWERLGRDGQERVVDRLRGLYAGASDEELASMARSLSDNAVYEYAVEKNMPSSALEYFGRTVADMNVLNSISKGIARSEAGASGDMAAYEAAMEEYGKDHTVAKVGGTVVGMAADPVTVLSGGAGAIAGKGALSLGGRILAQRSGISAAGAGTRYLGTTLGGRILAGSAGSAANLAAYEGLKEGERQFMYGGHIDPETFVNEGYSPGEILKSAGHGAMMGAIIGNVAPLIGKGSNAAVKAVSSTAGKLAVRGAEQGVSAVVEGTIFSVPQWIDGKTDAWDVWTDNMAMMLGFKASHGIKSAPRVIASLRPIEPKAGRPLTQAERNHNRMDFEERLCKRLDGSPDGLKFTAEERDELRRAGYGSLANLLRGDKTRERDGIQAETVAHSPEYDGYSAMEELMQDGRVSEAARAKAYYLLTGRQLPPSTIRSYRVVDGEDGRVYVQSLNADGGIVTSRRYQSREDARQETEALDRQIELNTIDVGERYKNDEVASKVVGAAYEDVAARSGGTWTAEGVRKAYEQAVRDQADPEKAAQMGQATKGLVDAVEAAASKHVGEFDDMTPEAIRKRINEAYEVDVDAAIRKPQDERSESEQTAVRKYVEELFPRERAEAAPTASESAVREARGSGYEITDPAAREQTMRATRYQEERLRKLFKRDDLEDMLREELGTDDAAEALDRLATSRYDDGERAAIADYLKSRESSRAVEQRMEDDARAAMDTQRVFIDKTSHEDGYVRPATMEVDDRPVYIVKGNVVLTDDGKMINTSASDGVIYVYDPAADKVEQTSPDQLAGLWAATTTVESHAEAERVIAQQLDRDLRAARGIIDTFNPGETYVVDFGAGARQFTIAGMGEDGKVLLQIDGDGKLYSLSPEHLSQYIDHYRQSAFESEMQPVADEGHMVAGPGAAKAAEQKQSKTADAVAMPYEFGDSFRIGISGRGESQQAAVVDSEGETVTIWTPFPVTDKSEKSRTTSGYTTDLSRGELDKSVMRDDNGRPVDYVQANPEPGTVNTAESLNGEGKSISLQSDNQQEQNGNGPEQNNDERALARQTDGGRVADDTARGMEAYRDRSDIRVYEEGVAAAYNAHTEYSERDRRDAESERLVGIAKAHGQYKSREEVRALGSVNLKRTGESEVFIDDDNRRVYKIKDPYAKSPMKGDVQPEDVIYEHLVHNKYFPETRYKFEGISDDTGDVRIVLSQGYVESIGQPTEAQIEAALAEKGLTRNGKYTFSNDEISVTDVTGDNALLGADGKVYFIDPIINFKKPVAEILGGVASEAPATEVAEARHGAPAVDGPESMPMRQVKEKGETWEEPDYLATTPARSHAYIYNESGLTRQEANEHVAHMAKSAGEAVEKHKKRAPQIGGSIARYQKEKAEWEAAGAELQRAVEFWDAVKGEQQRVVDSEKAVRDAENAREHDEAVARFEHEQRIKAEQQAEQDAVGTNAVNPKIKAKWDAALKITGNANVHVLSDGSTISGHYVLTEAGAASASHDPADGFRPTVGFPVDANGQNVNDRDYMRDADAQRMVRSMADAFDSRALQTPVIVSRDGVVLSGNNRTMSGDMAATQGTDKAYVDHLMQYGGMYGFSPEQIAGMKHPRVVFVPDVALPYDSATFARFNAQEMKSQSKPEAAVKLGKIVPDNVFGDIVGEISRYERLSDFYANETAASQALGALRGAGIVNDAQMPELRTGTALSAAGRELLENTLIGKVFQADPDAVRKIMEVPSMRQTVVMALSEIAANRGLSSRGYDIVDELSRAVDLCYRAKSAQPDVYVSGVPVSPFGRQHGLFDDEYGDSRVTDAATLLLADLLNDTKPSRLRNVLAVYNRGAGQAAAGSIDLFTGEVPSKETILSEINNHFINATPREQQALVDDAISERRQRAESAAEQRGGDPTAEQTAAAIPSNQGGRAAGDAREKNPVGATRDRSIDEWFGPVYTQFQGKGIEAEAHLQETCEGVAKGALIYPGLSPIDLVWGDKKAGYMKILIKHPEVAGKLQTILNECKIIEQSVNRVVLESDSHKVIVSKMKGSMPTDNWLLTAYQKKEKSVSASSSDIETEPEGKRNGTATPQNGFSDSKDNASLTEKQESAEKSSAMQALGVDTLPSKEMLARMSYDEVVQAAADYDQSIAEKYYAMIEPLESEKAELENKRRTAVEGRRLKAIDKEIVELERREEDERMAAGRYFAEEQRRRWKSGEAPQSLADMDAEVFMDEADALASGTMLRIADAEAATDTEPTEAQKAAGNYRKGHVSIDGFDVTIENPKGSVRRGTDADGKSWETTMHNTYGYIRGTEGVDGDHIDVFLSDNPTEGDVYVVDQYRPDGSFDEHKVMYGFTSAPDAEAAYLSNYSADWAKGRKIVTTGVSKDEFKKWVESSHRKKKPFAEYKSVKPIEAQSTPAETEAPEAPAEATEGYDLDVYETKKGKKFHRVKFPSADKEVWKERLDIAKEQFGGTSVPGGYGFKDAETAKAFAEAIQHPLSAEGLKEHTDALAESPRSAAAEHGPQVDGKRGRDSQAKAAQEARSRWFNEEDQEEAAELIRKMKDRLKGGRLYSGVPIDVELLELGCRLGYLIMKKGARKLQEYARAMIENLGDGIRPYIKQFYNATLATEEALAGEWYKDATPMAEIAKFDVVNFLKTSKSDVIEMARNITAEHEVKSAMPAAATEVVKLTSSKAEAAERKQYQPSLFDESIDIEPRKEMTSQENEVSLETETVSASNNPDKSISNETQINLRPGPSTSQRAGGHESQPHESLGARQRNEIARAHRQGVDRRGVVDPLSDRERGGGVSPQSEDRAPISESLGSERKNARNNQSERGVDYAPRGDDARIKANIEAIELAKRLLEAGESATPEQMAVLRRFSGWGGLGKAFSEVGGRFNPTAAHLRKLLGEDGYNDAVMSRNSAYYTPAYVIDIMWDIAHAMGFKGGRVLEGSAGIGNILGLMPLELSERSDIHAVEIDSTTGAILSLLYPDAQVDVQGFEKTRVRNGSVDLAITNVPFVSGLHVLDETGDKDLSTKFRDIHDFCIAKNIRKLRDGGLGIFITSSGTMDNSRELRRWITSDGNADVVGAFRMHNKTFGGTGATSDIIVVRKRVGGRQSSHAIDVADVAGVRVVEYHPGETRKVKGQEVPIVKRLPMEYNKYFVEHPENMGGEMRFGFEEGDTYRPQSKALYPVKGKEQADLLSAWASRFADMTEDSPGVTKVEDEVAQINEQLGAGVKEGSMMLDSTGELCVARMGEAVPLELNNKKVKGHSKAECFEAYSAIKQALSAVLEYQSGHDDNAGLAPLLRDLNHAYDTFVRTYGNLHKNTAISFLRNDVDFSSILALETYSERGNERGEKIVSVGKTDIFSRRVIENEKEPQPVTVKDGILASLYKSGGVDVDYIARTLGKSADEVKHEIIAGGLGFENPASGMMEVSYQYLSGNVRDKLNIARENNDDGRYDANIKALERVLPMTIPAHLIEFSLGSSWIESKLYEDFVYDKTGIRVTLTNAGGTWFMKTPWSTYNEKNRAMAVVSKMCDKTIMGHELIESAITNKAITVSKTERHYDGSTETITDKTATAECSTKVDEIRAEFKDWARGKMQADPDMSARIELVYNERFNNYVPMTIPDEYVPSHFGGQVSELHGRPFALRPHQGRAVVRATTQPVLLAHEVGTGKTYTLITTAMEMRRLGTARKPMIVVQNATVGQFVESAKEIYPNAKVLTIEEADRTADGRRNFYAKIKYNDWDMIVVPQSVFERIPDSEEREMAYVKDLIEEKMQVLKAIREADSDSRNPVVRRAEKEIDDFRVRLAELTESMSDKKKRRDEKREATTRQNVRVRAMEMLDRTVDDVENFDDMGIDAILVDEAHEYKHLGFSTAMQRGVKGVDPSYSKKSQGVFLKAQAVMERNHGRNVVFATGTPISNTAAEIWTFMRYLMPADVMKGYGLYYFDDFVRNFGNIAQMVEFTTSGKFKENSRFAGYVNLPELVRIWSGVADTVLTRDVGGVSDKIPDMEGAKPRDIYLPQTRALRGVMKYVKAELDRYEDMTGKEKKENSHIPLTMYGIAKAAAVDVRLVVTDAEDDPNSKTNATIRETLRSLADSERYRGTVAIFSDNYQNKHSGFNLYEDIRSKLIVAGVPSEQIVIIKSGMTVKKKLEIFDKVNAGEIRVIMGSTFTLGTGVNIQERLHTLIHVDAPNRPMDYTQRNGRALRQGNLHKDMGIPVRIIRFGVEDSLDVTAYQRLKTKGAIADSIMNGSKMMQNSMENRVLEEEDDSFGDMTAQLSGSEYAILKNQAEREVRSLIAKQKGHDIDQIYVHNQLPKVEGFIKGAERRIALETKNLEIIGRHFPDGTIKKITVGRLTFDSVEAMEDFFKEQNAKMNEAAEAIREGVDNYTSRLTVDVDGLRFEIVTTVERVMDSNGQGALSFEPERRVTYSCESLGINDVSPKGNRIKGVMQEIVRDIATGKTCRELLNRGQEQLAHYTEEQRLLLERSGKEFPYKEQLADAKERLARYEEAMRLELAEKEAKYAEMDKTVEAVSGIDFTEEDSAMPQDGIEYRTPEEGIEYFNARSVQPWSERLDHLRFKRDELGESLSLSERREVRELGEQERAWEEKWAAGHTDTDVPTGRRSRFDFYAAQYGQGGMVADIRDAEREVGPLRDRSGALVSANARDMARRALPVIARRRDDLLSDRPKYSRAGQAAIDAELADLEYMALYYQRMGEGEDVERTMPGRVEHQRMLATAREVAASLGEKVVLYEAPGDIHDTDVARLMRKRRSYGWYNPNDGTIHINVGRHTDSREIMRTVLHEVIGHKTIEEILGPERFARFIDEVWNHADGDVRAKIGRKIHRHGWDYREATKEYLGEIAEEINEKGYDSLDAEKKTVWQRVKAKIEDFFNRILEGLKIPARVHLTERDLSYMLWKLMRHQQRKAAGKPSEGDILDKAEDIVRREEWQRDEAGLQIVARDGIISKRERIDKLRKSMPVKISGKEVEAAEDIKQYKKNALEYGKRLQGEYVNEDTGQLIQLQRGRRNGGLKEILQHDITDRAHIQSVAALPQIIEKGIYIESVPNMDVDKNPDVAEYQHYVCGLKIGDDDYTVHSIVAVDKRGDRYYDHKLSRIEKGKLLDFIEAKQSAEQILAPMPGTKPTIRSERKINELISLLQIDDEIDSEMRYMSSEPEYRPRQKPAPRNTIKVYKLVRIKEERPGEWFPLFIDSAAPLRLGEWLDADSPDLEMLRGREPGQYLVNPQTKEVLTREEVYQQHPELRSMIRGHDTKYPSVDAINYATDNGLRWMEIEETDKAQRRFDGENRRYWNLGINGSGSVSTFSMRPGWHAGSLPTMRQIGKGKNKDLRDDNFVWVEGEVSADVDYQAEAERNPDKDLPDRIPEDGFYMKATNVNKTTSQADRVGWYVAGSFKANRFISDAEARQIIDDFNAAHPDMAPVAYDYDRESGRTYDPEAGLHFRDGDDMQNMTIEERTLKLAVMLADRHSGDVAVRDAAVEALGKTLGNIRKAMGTQHTYDFNTVRSLSAVADILISSGTFQPEGRGEIKRLYGIMKRGIGHAYTDKAGVEHVAQSEKDFNEAVESLMDLFVDNQLKVSERFLADVMKIRGSKVNARGVEVMGELDIEGQIMVRGLKDYMEMDIQTIRSRIETLDEQIANGNEAASMTAAAEKMGVQLAEQYVEEVADRAAQERIMRDELRDKSAWDPAMSGAVRKAYSEHKRALRESIRKIRIERAEAMRQLASQIGNELRGSIERVKAFREREKERIEAIHHNANSDMTGRPYDEHGMKKKGIGVKLSNNMVSRLLLAPAATFEQIMRVFGSKSVDGEGYLYDRFVRGWQECRDKEWISTQEVEGILNKKAAEILGKRNARWSDLYALTRKAAGSCDWWDGGEIREHKVTQGNLMYMYMVNKMTDGQVKLRRMCITEENMQEIEQALDPRLKEVADWLQSDLLPNLRNKYNEVHMRMLGAPMAEIENYFPLKILANARLEEVEMAGKVDGKDLPKTMTGSIIKRRYNNYALDVLNSDAVSIALDHIREMETWAAFAEYRRDLCTLLSYKHFRNQVKNMSTLYGSGEKLWDKFYDLSLLVGGAYQPKTSEFDKVAVNITKLATGACIAIRLNTALKQLLSYPAFAPDANLARLMYNVTPWRARVCWKWAMKNMPSFQRRWKSRQAGNDLLRAWKFDWDWTRADFVQKVQRAGITPNAFIDALTVAMGSEAVYQSKLKGYLKDGFSKEEAHRRAIQDAEIIFNLSQQSSELPYLSLLQNDRSYLTTCITNFRNSPMSYLRQSIQSKRELANMVKGKDVQIEFETKKGVREGLTPEQAKARAERKYKRNWARDLFKSTTFDYILPALWAFGLSGMWYCIFGNDDEKKKQYAEEAMKRGMLGGLEGFTFGGTMPDFMYGLATGDKPQLDEETSPAMGLITDMANLYSNGKTERAANEMINTMIALGVGVNPQVLEDGVVAGIDFFGEDEKSARDWALLFMRVMSCPQSQMDQVYFDELGMDAREAQSKSPAELAERYATYKARRANFATMWAYDDDRWENEIKGTWRKRFETEAKKRLNGLSESDVNDRLEGYDAEWTETGKRLKRLLTEPGDTISRAERYRDLYESGPGTRRKLYEDLHPYLDKMIKSWLTAPTAEDAAKEAATIVEYKAKVVEMLDASDDREKSLKLRREAMAIALDWEKRHQPQKSGAVSQ